MERFMSEARAKLLEHNRKYCETFCDGSAAAQPSMQLAILTCMDARIMPEAALGIETGEAHMIRNAGGRATDDAIRSLILSHHVLGTREVFVVHHTDCGMKSVSEAALCEKLLDETGHDASHIDFHAFTDPEAALREDVERIRACPYLCGRITVTGFMYDVRTGSFCCTE